MTDISALIEILNSRFDDLTNRIESLKADMHRAQDRHALENKETFHDHHTRLGDIERMKWRITGGMIAITVIANVIIKIIELRLNV